MQFIRVNYTTGRSFFATRRRRQPQEKTSSWLARSEGSEDGNGVGHCSSPSTQFIWAVVGLMQHAEETECESNEAWAVESGHDLASPNGLASGAIKEFSQLRQSVSHIGLQERLGRQSGRRQLQACGKPIRTVHTRRARAAC